MSQANDPDLIIAVYQFVIVNLWSEDQLAFLKTSVQRILAINQSWVWDR